MTANEWVGIAVGVSAVSTSLLLGLRWVIKSYLAELKPNGGSSIKDTVSRLELQNSRLEKRVDDLFTLISKS
jgi:hypothetical protein